MGCETIQFSAATDRIVPLLNSAIEVNGTNRLRVPEQIVTSLVPTTSAVLYSDLTCMLKVLMDHTRALALTQYITSLLHSYNLPYIGIGFADGSQ